MSELTVPLNDRLAGPFAAVVGQTDFTFDFPVFAANDLLVVRRRSGTETVLQLTTHYTVNGVGAQNGGTVVLATGSIAGDVIVIYGAEQAERISNFQPPPNSPSSIDLNAQLNSLQMQLQELATKVGRVPRLRDTDSAGNMRIPLATDRIGKALGFDAVNGQSLVPLDLSLGPPGPPGPQGPPADDTVALEFVFDFAGVPILPGADIDLEVPFACTIDHVTLLADRAGSIQIDIWKDAFANYPPTLGDSITASAKPTITSATTYQDGELTGWDKDIAAGDVLRAHVVSASTLTRCVLSLTVKRAGEVEA